MRRKRGSRGTWLPVLPTALTQSEGGTQYATWYEDSYSMVGFNNSYNGDAVAVPLIPDFTPQDANLTGQQDITLRDLVEGQDYVLKRTVGKVWATINNQAGSAGDFPLSPYIFCLALAVLPVQDDNQSIPAMPNADFCPLNSQNSQQPWLWRRTWILQNTLNATQQTVDFPAYGAQSTWQYGSIADGGHLDTKVQRRVRKDQRLFIVAQAGQLLFGDGGTELPSSFRWGYDLRFFGAMRKANNKSTFK